MEKIETNKLIEKIKEVFLTEDKFQIKKTITEFDDNGKFLGDYFTYIICEKQKSAAPLFYNILSPYDIVSKKDPQYAIIWQAGEIKLNIDYTEYAAMRTGIMDALVLKELNIKNLNNHKIIIFGAGKIAKYSVQAIKDCFPELKNIDYKSSKRNIGFEEFGRQIGISSQNIETVDISKYDFIFCHTSANESILKKDQIKNIKKDAVITTFISSAEHGEIDDEYYSPKANIILDWEQNLVAAKDLSRALKSNFIKKEQIVLFKNFLKGNKLDKSKDYTIFRFKGTPHQNLAVLKLLS